MQFTLKHHALMYGFIAKTILTSGVPDSFDLLRNATRKCAAERGRRMAQRAQTAGDPLDMVTFIAYSEWKPNYYSDFVADVLVQFPVYTFAVTQCEWWDIWQQYGLSDYCRTYCEVFETSVMDGFSSVLDLQIPRTLFDGASGCVFIYNGLPFSRETLSKIVELQEKVKESSICPWEYHTAHLYYTISRELIAVLGQEKATPIITKMLCAFGQEFGANDVKTVLAFENIDFGKAEHPEMLFYV